MGKVVQPLQSVKICYNSRAHGQERPGPSRISGYMVDMGCDDDVYL